MCHNCQNPHCARSGCREQTKVIQLPVELDYTGTFPAEEYLKRRETGLESTSDPESEGYDIQRDAAMLESLIHMQHKPTLTGKPPWRKFADEKPEYDSIIVFLHNGFPVICQSIAGKVITVLSPVVLTHRLDLETLWCYEHEFMPFIQPFLP